MSCAVMNMQARQPERRNWKCLTMPVKLTFLKRLGFKPVFFGETLIGELRPNLMYMITFDDMAAHDTHWKSFVADTQWKRISVIPDYADAKLVSKITSAMLKTCRIFTGLIYIKISCRSV